MRRRRLHLAIAVATALTMVVSSLSFTYAAETGDSGGGELITGVNPAGAQVSVDWNARYHYADLEKQLQDLNTAYPDFSSMYSIGKTNEERDMWCMEITNRAIPDKYKTKIAVFGNIHGGEGESGACAMYSAWYLLENSGNADIAEILDKYIVYVIPIINPDGYEQSFIYRTRENMKPVDHNNDGIPFNDPYVDIDGDGFVGSVYALASDGGDTSAYVGIESADSDGNGVMGDDPKNSGVDLNRNFNFFWGKDGKMDTEGPSAASELEAQAVQNFLGAHKDIKALTTLHTGIQTVLYPWGYRAPSEDQDDMADIEFMKDTSLDMAKAMMTATQRNFYTKQSFYDYPTYSELIDYAYGKYRMHPYTIEVYQPGSTSKSAYQPDKSPADLGEDDCGWNNTLPEKITKDYTHEEAVELLEAAGVDPAKLQVKEIKEWRTWGSYRFPVYADELRAWGDDEGLRIETGYESQMVGKAPEHQDEMVSGVMAGILTMIESEAPGDQTDLGVIKDLQAELDKYAKPEQVTGLVLKAGKKKATVAWAAADKADTYKVYRSTKKTSGFKCVKTTSALKYTNKKLKKGKRYYFKVRAVRNIPDGTAYGDFSEVKSVKVK